MNMLVSRLQASLWSSKRKLIFLAIMPLAILAGVLIMALVKPFFVATRLSPEQEAELAESQQITEKAVALHSAGKLSAAESVFRQALMIAEKVLGPEHIDVAVPLNNLARVYQDQGQYARAESLYKRAVEIREKALGSEHPEVARVLANLGGVYAAQGRYGEAERVYLRALSIQQKTSKSGDGDTAQMLNNLAGLYYDEGRYAEAESFLKRSLTLWEKLLGREHRDVATNLSNLAAVYDEQGRYVESESLYQQAVAILEKTLGPGHPDLAASLNNLAVLYRTQGNYTQAEALLKRALAILEPEMGRYHPEVAGTLNNLAGLYLEQRRYADARSLFRRSLVIWEKLLGPEHPNVAMNLNNLAGTYKDQNDYSEAESLYRRSLAIGQKAGGPGDLSSARTVNNLGLLYLKQKQYARANTLLRQALEIHEKNLGREHPAAAVILSNLAQLLDLQKQFASARPYHERARRIQLTVARVNSDLGEDALRGLLSSAQLSLSLYTMNLAAIAQSSQLDDKPGSAQRDAFVVAEQTRSGLAQSALAKSSARASFGDPVISSLARTVQDLRNRRQAVGKQLTEEYGKPTAQRNNERLQNLQKLVSELDAELKQLTERLYKAFPKYAELSAPEPIGVATTQKLLQLGEALISYFTLDDRLLIWLLRRGQEPVYKDIEIKRTDLVKLIATMRGSMDQSRNLDLEKRGLLSPFDVAASHTLYHLLFEPLKERLAGVRHLIIVPDEALLPLPFGALVTKVEGEAYQKLASLHEKKQLLDPLRHSEELRSYQQLSWLAKDYAITVLPSATSLRALRQIERPKRSETEPLIAFGDPVLQGRGIQRGGTMLASRGVRVPVEEIRKLDRLPGTRGELESVARALGADLKTALYLDQQAAKPVVMKLNGSGRLARAEVVAFATHGLIAGELTGLKEPALVLTPPKDPTDEDNGLLGLEDILSLKLDNAEWVILSACNTAAADGSGEGLSGLVRAFFFAGARSLLVSHWSVDDSATQVLMTEIFERYAKDKTMPRSEALRQGMLALMGKAQGETSYFAHPFAWAPFFLVGEGN